jgi:O-antigen/teichoic acid export membrane protein
MAGLLKLQIISFISRIIAMFIGIFQSLIIVNLLSKEEYGLIGLVTSIAGIVGITQHLGLASSSTKEISQAKDSQEIFNVILSSLSIRMLISVPISLILVFLSPQIADYYKNAELIMPLQIFGIITLVQAFQSIFNSIVSGTQRFKLLFSYQVLIALVSLIIFLPLIYFYSLIGYFYALLVFNLTQTILLGYFSTKGLNFKFKLPSKKDFFSLSSKLLKISLAIYFVKILFTAWQEVPVAFLGKVISLESLALFTFAFNLSSKLMAISDSITDVNLPVFSKKSTESISDYTESFLKNFDLLFYFIFIVGISVSFWSREILIGSDYLIYLVGLFVGFNFEKNIFERYSESTILFFPLILSMIFYSYQNIIKSSFFVPMERLKKMIATYIVLILTTSISFYFINFYFIEILSMSLALFIGSFLSFVLSVFFIYQDLNTKLLDFKKVIFCTFAIFIGLISYLINLDLYSKVVIYISFLIVLFSLFKINVLSLLRKRK